MSLLNKSHSPLVQDSQVSPGSPTISSVLISIPSSCAVLITLSIASSSRLTRLICFSTSWLVLCSASVKRLNIPAFINFTAMSTSPTVAFLLQLVSNTCGYPYCFLIFTRSSAISMSRSLNMPKLASVLVINSDLFFAIQSSSSSMRSRLNFFTLENVVPPQSQKVHIKGQPLLVSITAFQILSGYSNGK